MHLYSFKLAAQSLALAALSYWIYAERFFILALWLISNIKGFNKKLKKVNLRPLRKGYFNYRYIFSIK